MSNKRCPFCLSYEGKSSLYSFFSIFSGDMTFKCKKCKSYWCEHLKKKKKSKRRRR